MNGVGMYQNYMTSFQEMNQLNNREGKKPEEKKQQKNDLFEKPEAVYERTSSDEDIRKAMEKKENPSWEKKEDTTDKNSLENFTIAKNSNQEVKLSDKAQKVLDELKEKYGNMDFFVADFSTDEEAQQYLSQGTKEYSVVIDPETLEQMAEDEEVYQKYDNILANAGNTFAEVKEQLGEDADKVANLGIMIDGDGKVSLFAELDKQSVRMAETQKKMQEEKAAEKKEQKEAEEKKAEEETEKEKAMQKAEEAKEFLQKMEEKGKELPGKESPKAGPGNWEDTEKMAWNRENEKGQEDERMTFRVTGSSVEELVNAVKNAVLE